MDITNTIAIYGKSGHGKVIADIAMARGFKEILWIDDDPKKGALRFLDFYEFHHDVPVLLGVGDNHVRQKLFHMLKSKGFSLPSISHPSAVISESATIAEASVIMPNAVINADTKISLGVIINTGVIVEHDCSVDDFVHISPNAALAGGVHISRFSHIGLGANIIQGLSVGENSIVGAGAAVISDLPSNCTAVGVPAKVITS
jgi:UDP-N-acetylbacillosamine N-acetyltransferase